MQSSREAWLDADIKRLCMRLLFSLRRSWFLNKCYVYGGSADSFFFKFSYYLPHQTRDCPGPDRNFFRRLNTNKPQGGKTKKKKNTDKQRKKKKEKTHQLSIWQTTSFVAPLSFLSHLLRRTESPPMYLFLFGMTAPLTSPETPFFFPFFPLSLPSSLWLLFSQNFMN